MSDMEGFAMNRLGGWSWVALFVALCSRMGPALAQAPAPTVGFPGGASSVQETFEDWRVTCVAQPDNRKGCGAVQEQADSKTHQRLLVVQFDAPTRDGLSGMLVLPFGLSIDRGVVPQLDDGPTEAPLHFRTCLPGGCLVPLVYDAKAMAALRKATALKLKAAADGGNDVAFTILLKGLPSALDRLSVLAK